MTQHLSNCIQVMAVMVAAAPIALAQEPPKNFIMHDGPEANAAVRFEYDHGEPRSLAEFRGRIVLLNVWATWCGRSENSKTAHPAAESALL
jgi:thiol-disulfide isomerase/thioredoxin